MLTSHRLCVQAVKLKACHCCPRRHFPAHAPSPSPASLPLPSGAGVPVHGVARARSNPALRRLRHAASRPAVAATRPGGDVGGEAGGDAAGGAKRRGPRRHIRRLRLELGLEPELLALYPRDATTGRARDPQALRARRALQYTRQVRPPQETRRRPCIPVSQTVMALVPMDRAHTRGDPAK